MCLLGAGEMVHIVLTISRWNTYSLPSLSKTVFAECDSQGRLIDTDKWDNHNTIARGWLTSGEDHYQPVTFRKIYNSKNQPMGVSPMPNQNISHADTEQMAQQAHHQQMMHPSNDNNTVPVDVPEEGCADLWSTIYKKTFWCCYFCDILCVIYVTK